MSIFAQGATKELRFEILEGNEQTIFLGLSKGESKTVPYEVYGYVDATVEYDEWSLEPKRVVFTGGRIVFSDHHIVVSKSIHYNQYGLQPTTIGYTESGLAFVPGTSEQGGSVSKSRETYHVTGYNHLLSSGVTDYHFDIGDLDQGSVRDYTQNPLLGQVMSGIAIEIENLSKDPFEDSLRFSLIYNANAGGHPTRIPETDTLITLRRQGIFSAVAIADFVSPFGEWVEDEGLAIDSPNELNSSGVPYGVVFAFGQSPESRTSPLRIIASDEPMLVVDLPASGLKRDVIIEYSASLSSDDWMRLPDSLMEQNSDSLNAGRSQETLFKVPSHDRAFFRIGAGP